MLLPCRMRACLRSLFIAAAHWGYQMRSEQDCTSSNRLTRAKLAWWATACLVAASPMMSAQQGSTGVSVPQPVTAVDPPTPDAAPPAKPSAAIPMSHAAPDAPVVFGPYVPYRGSAASSAAPATGQDPTGAFDPDASIVTPENLHRRPLTAASERADNTADPDANIVTRVPTRDGEVNEGTLIKARLRETLSTTATQPGSHFSAEVSEPVMQEGRVYIPAGSVLEGRVSWVSGGKRIGGRAAIHIEPDHVTLPDGTEYNVHARVIDTSSWENTAVDNEGTIIRKDNVKGTLEAGGLATGGAIAAGAVLAGPAGALVGAGVGAGVTAIVWFKQDRQATLPKDLGVIFSLTAPLSVEPAHAALPSTATPEKQGGE